MKNRLTGLLGVLFFILISHPLFGDNQGYGGNHMGFMGDNIGNHMGVMGGGWMMIIWIALLVVVIVAVGKLLTTKGHAPMSKGPAHDILDQRYAKGEISEEEFKKMKHQLD